MNPILKDWTPPARPTHPRPPGATVTRLALVGEIAIERSIELFAEIRAAAEDTIELHVDSGGGNALAAIALYELLTLHQHHVVANIVNASSGAVLVALGADVRRVAPGAWIMVHETRADLSSASADVLRSTLADLELFDGMALAILAAATGQAPERVADWRRATTKFSAHQAIAAGLAHEIA